MGPYPGQPVTHGRRCKENISVLDIRCSFFADSLVEQGLAEIVRSIRAGDPASSGPRCDPLLSLLFLSKGHRREGDKMRPARL